MFDTLSKYLWEFKEITLPHIGSFECKAQPADTNPGANTIAAPRWDIIFSENNTAAPVGDADAIATWLSGQKNISQIEAANNFNNFAEEIKSKLTNGETITWFGIGNLSEQAGRIIFTPAQESISPFTDITAHKIKRENTSYATLVGDKETTTAQMREQLTEANYKTKRTGRGMWVLLMAAIVLLVIYFLRNGCNVTATGNNNKATIEKNSDTYRIR